jgi:hypothetical protein
VHDCCHLPPRVLVRAESVLVARRTGSAPPQVSP